MHSAASSDNATQPSHGSVTPSPLQEAQENYVILSIGTTCPNNIVDSGVLQVSMSDHYIVYCLRKLNGTRRKDHKVIKMRPINTLIQLLFSWMCLKLIGIEWSADLLT